MVRISERAQAQRVIEALVDQCGVAVLREQVGQHRAQSSADSDLTAAGIEALLAGELVLVHVGEVPRRLDPPRIVPLIDPARPIPDERARPTDWIGLSLLDADGAPVVDEPYAIRFSDGRTAEGRTDAHGQARHDNIAKGSCQISFPRIWPTEWMTAHDAVGRTQERRPEAADSSAAPPGAGSGSSDAVAHPESTLVAAPERPSAPGCTWIAFEVEAVDGRPLAGQAIGLMLPDGRRVETTLDDGGRAEVLDVVGGGACRLSLMGPQWETSNATYATGTGHVVVARRRAGA